MIYPSRLFTAEEKDVARRIYHLASETYLDLFNPLADREKMKEKILKWRVEIDRLLNMLERAV